MVISFNLLRSNSALLFIFLISLHFSVTFGQDTYYLHGPPKLFVLLIISFTTFVLGVSPYFMRLNKSFMLFGSQFAGGVFLGTGLMRFLRDSNKKFALLLTYNSYPFALLLALLGYLFSMYGYYLILNVSRRAAGDSEHGGSGGGDIGGGGEVGQISGVLNGSTRGGAVGVAAGRWENRVVVEVEEGRRNRGNTVEHGKEIIRDESFTILLILILCSHSIIESIYIGQAYSNAEAWGFVSQIIPYNIFASLALGITILSLIPKRPFLLTVVYAFAFAISTTIGIAIGIAIVVYAYTSIALDWIYAILTSIACGALLYVAIHHIISKGFKPQEDSNSHTQLLKFLALLLGVAVIALVMIRE